MLPLLAEAMAVMATVPEAPAAHCTVTVPVPLETTVAMVGPMGLLTTNCPRTEPQKSVDPCRAGG